MKRKGNRKNEPHLMSICGVPGFGKITYAKRLEESLNPQTRGSHKQTVHDVIAFHGF